ncbi:MAG: TAXI family TRAP transporter solute-binding subunit [Alphaproteobacteria bacterium]|nr:TAXI family TRAP transporter solute-binding subunit [Alphaproteobacteria bacterium]
MGLVITHVWNKNIDFVRAGSYASNGAVDNLIQVSNGDANVSMAISSNCFQSYYGLDLFTDHENKKLRVIAGLYPQFNQIIVSQKSGITKLQDVKGHSFAVANKGSAVEGECQNHFTAAGLNYPTDFQAEYSALGDASSRLINGTIDGAWVMGGFPMSSIIVACTNGCKLLTVDDDVIYELQKTFPW